MTTFLIIVFVAGYMAIALEHPLKIDKAATALLTGVLCWTIYIMTGSEKELITDSLLDHLGDISSILFFLLGAMTIVELIDSHDGFTIITERIKTRSMVKLLWIVSVLTFFLSAILDNLTTTIVMTSLTAKILNDKNDRLWFAGMIVIAANAGGAFSPLGDVTTTMLWIGGQITAQNVITTLFIPSLFVSLIPLAIVSPRFRNKTFSYSGNSELVVAKKEGVIILALGILLILFIPVFKIITHLPPFMGIMFSLGILWVVASVMHKRKSKEDKRRFSVTAALHKIDTPSILFFLGILLAVSALQSFGLLGNLATFLNKTFENIFVIGSLLGLLSSIIDNVPLVAAAQGMYSLTAYPTDHLFWEFLTLTTGTGGSAIIIGSAAGIAAMGIEKIEFVWYLKNISWIALAGFAGGIVVFLLQTQIF